MKHEDACAIPLPFATAFAGVFTLGVLPSGSSSNLPLPGRSLSTPPILVWGAASSVGAMATQLFKLSGHRVVATCSPKNFDYVKSLGADWVVDYNDMEKVVIEIRKITERKLGLVYEWVAFILGARCKKSLTPPWYAAPSRSPSRSRLISSASARLVVSSWSSSLDSTRVSRLAGRTSRSFTPAGMTCCKSLPSVVIVWMAAEP